MYQDLVPCDKTLPWLLMLLLVIKRVIWQCELSIWPVFQKLWCRHGCHWNLSLSGTFVLHKHILLSVMGLYNEGWACLIILCPISIYMYIWIWRVHVIKIFTDCNLKSIILLCVCFKYLAQVAGWRQACEDDHLPSEIEELEMALHQHQNLTEVISQCYTDVSRNTSVTEIMKDWNLSSWAVKIA
jgi:hypothetical protein